MEYSAIACMMPTADYVPPCNESRGAPLVHWRMHSTIAYLNRDVLLLNQLIFEYLVKPSGGQYKATSSPEQHKSVGVKNDLHACLYACCWLRRW